MLRYDNTIKEEVALLILRTAEDEDEHVASMVKIRANSVCCQLSRFGMSGDESDQHREAFIKQATKLRLAWLAIN